MSEGKFGSWSVDQSPVTIEYSLVVIEEIRHEVAQGFQKLSRGGIEVGGVLYGTREGRTIRLLAIRPIECEHARGPAFLLSDRDRQVLAQQLARDREDPQLEGFICAGWFLSHTRSEIMLAESDLQIYDEYFPAPWQVTMVIRPGRSGSMRAGFFVRENDGRVMAEQSYLEFNFPDRLAGVLDRTSRGERPERRARPRAELGGAAAAPAPAAATREAAPPVREVAAPPPMTVQDVPQFAAAVPEPSSGKGWLWALLGLALGLGLGALGFRYWNVQQAPTPQAPSIALTVLEKEGQLQIQWNHSAHAITAAAKGTLTIADGNDTQNVPLTPVDLARGTFTYQRKTGDIEVRMNVQETDGSSVQESSRFLGQPPAAPKTDEIDALDARRVQLEAEIQRLQRDNNAQAEKIQQLERTLRILQTRLGIK